MTPIRLLLFINVITWTIATVRVWDDAHNPYTTALCATITTTFIIATAKTRKGHNHEIPRN